MESKIRTIIVDDHKIFRRGLRMILDEFKNVNVIAEVSNGIELLEQLKIQTPDLIFMDIKMPVMDGVKASKEVLTKYPDIKIIALSMYGDEKYYHKMLDAGVKSFVLKDADIKELELAVNATVNENSYYISQKLLKHLYTQQKPLAKKSTELTERELEVLQLIAKGLTNEEIAEKLFLSKRTIDRHRSNILQKTNTKNSVSLIIYAVKNNLIDLTPIS